MTKALLRWLAPIVRRLQDYVDSEDLRRRLATALAPGTIVELSCTCAGYGGVEGHAGQWRIVRYNADVDDYRLARISDDRIMFVRCKDMGRIVEHGSSP